MNPLEKLFKLTNQEIFDIALRDTKEACFVYDVETTEIQCRYKDGNGNHCGVGKLLLHVEGNDSHEVFESTGDFRGLLVDFEAEELWRQEYHKFSFVSRIQRAHDSAAHSAHHYLDVDFRQDFIKNMRAVAHNYNIEFKEELV